MKFVTAIIRPFKLDEVRDALTKIGVQGADGHRGTGLRASKGPHGSLSRRGIRRALPTEDQGRDRLPIQSSRQGHRDNHLVRENRKDRRRQDLCLRPRPCGTYSHRRNRRRRDLNGASLPHKRPLVSRAARDELTHAIAKLPELLRRSAISIWRTISSRGMRAVSKKRIIRSGVMASPQSGKLSINVNKE
jgi:hypothetical protein